MKVLVGTLTKGKTSGGVDQYLFQFLDNVKQNNSSLQLDFLTHDYNIELEQELNSYGSKLHIIPSLKYPIKQYRRIRSLIREYSYDVVYFNISTSVNFVGTYAAQKEKLSTRIVHAHSNGFDIQSNIKRQCMSLLNFIFKTLISRLATHYWTNSEESAVWVFGSHFINKNTYQVIPLPIDLSTFHYQPNIRVLYREQFQLKDEIIFGHVGRFSYQKNHRFLLNVFHKLHSILPQSKLILVGVGELYHEVQSYIKELGLDDSVMLLGKRNDISNLMQVFDVFLFPSRFEGAGIVVLEAEACGVSCYVSDSVPKVVDLANQLTFLDIKSNNAVSNWANHIVSDIQNGRLEGRESNHTIQTQFILKNYGLGTYNYANALMKCTRSNHD